MCSKPPTIWPSGVTTYEYGAKGSPLAGLLTATNYPTYKETYQYDQRGRQTAITQHLGSNETRTQHQGYDATGQRISSTDPTGRTTVPGVWVAGNATDLAAQVGTAAAQGAWAAAQLTMDLVEEESTVPATG